MILDVAEAVSCLSHSVFVKDDLRCIFDTTSKSQKYCYLISEFLGRWFLVNLLRSIHLTQICSYALAKSKQLTKVIRLMPMRDYLQS